MRAGDGKQGIKLQWPNIVYLAVTQENEQPPAEKEAADKEGEQQLPPSLSLSLFTSGFLILV